MHPCLLIPALLLSAPRPALDRADAERVIRADSRFDDAAVRIGAAHTLEVPDTLKDRGVVGDAQIFQVLAPAKTLHGKAFDWVRGPLHSVAVSSGSTTVLAERRGRSEPKVSNHPQLAYRFDAAKSSKVVKATTAASLLSETVLIGAAATHEPHTLAVAAAVDLAVTVGGKIALGAVALRQGPLVAKQHDAVKAALIDLHQAESTGTPVGLTELYDIYCRAFDAEPKAQASERLDLYRFRDWLDQAVKAESALTPPG